MRSSRLFASKGKLGELSRSPVDPSITCKGRKITFDTPIVVSLLSMHHIYCEEKKAAIVERALALELGGLYVFGKPGRVVVEGLCANVQRYERDLRLLRWQKLMVMGRISGVVKPEFVGTIDDEDVELTDDMNEIPQKPFCKGGRVFSDWRQGLQECPCLGAMDRILEDLGLLELVALAQRPFSAPRFSS